MRSDIFFSIIIPTYNRASFIKETVDSVLMQRYNFYEVVIIDDGSTDDTESIIKQIGSPVIRYQKIENSERGAARNYGVKIARGDYVTFLDSDDQLYPDYLLRASICLKKYSNPVFYHQGYEVKTVDNRIIRKSPEIISNQFEFLVKGNPLSCLGVFLRRDQALLHPFIEDRNLSGSEDWELWLRMVANFGIYSDKTVCASLILHNDRSVLNIDEERLLTRKNLALHYAFKDPMVVKIFGKYRNKMEAFCDTYISLHLALIGENRSSLKYLIQAIRNYPFCIFERRFLAIIKYLIKNLYSKPST